MTKNKTNKLFTPVDGVIVKIEKEVNVIGIELPSSSKKKNEGVIVSSDIFFSPKRMKELKEVRDNIKMIDSVKEIFEKGTKVKFTEGYELEDDLLFVKIEKIIGIY